MAHTQNSVQAPVVSSNGKLIHVFDGNGKALRDLEATTGAIVRTFAYDNEDRLIEILDAFGESVTLSYDASGSITITAPNGATTHVQHDGANGVAAISNSASQTWSLTQSSTGLLTSFTNPRNGTSNYYYDADGRLQSDQGPAGGGWSITRDIDENSFDVNMTSTEGRTTTYRREAIPTGGDRQIRTEPDGSMTTTDRLPDGRLVTTSADGSTIEYKPGPDPRFGMQKPVAEMASVSLPGGLSHAATASRSVTLSDPADVLSLVSQTDTVTINGRQTTAVFDANLLETTVTSPEGRIATMHSNAVGQPVMLQTTGLAEMAYTYTTEGSVQTITVGSGAEARSTIFTYYLSGPSKGYLSSITDPENRVFGYEYDLAGRVTKQILPDLREVAYAYDANGNLTTITPPGRPSHHLTFTSVDLNDSYTPPDVLPGDDATAYAFNLDKQLELVTLPTGQTIDYVYGNSTGRLEQVVTPAGSYDYAYHAGSGQLATLTAPGGEQITYTYDGFLTTVVTWSGNVNGAVTYDYNNDFRVNNLSVNGSPISFSYDDDGLLTAAGNLSLLREMASGLPDATTLGLVTTDADHNVFGEFDHLAAAVSGSVVYAVDFQRDKLGRITRKTETIQGSTTVNDYTYDLAGRLDTVSENSMVVRDYAYDSNGNRTTVNGITVAYYDDQDRLTSYESCNYTYEEDGSLDVRSCGADVLDLDYDIIGNLRHVVLPDGTTVDYVVDGQNRRIGKKVNGTPTQGFLYQDQLNPVAELDGSGSVLSRFVYAEKANVPSYMLKNGNTYRIISDHLGSVRLVVDAASGTVVQRMDFDEWGNVTQDTNPGFQPFGFAGGIYDHHTGLTRFGARDYDPETGRWTAKDPIGFAGGLNHYTYVNNDSLNFIDPTGLSPTECDKIADDIAAEQETIRRLFEMMNNWQPGQGYEDYGLAPDASMTGYRSDGFTNHSGAYQGAVNEMEGNIGFNAGIMAGNIIIGGVGYYSFGLHGYINGTTAARQNVLTHVASEIYRSQYVLNRLKRAYKDCECGG